MFKSPHVRNHLRPPVIAFAVLALALSVAVADLAMAGGGAAPDGPLRASDSGAAKKRCKTVRRTSGGRVVRLRVCCRTVRRQQGGKVVRRRVCTRKRIPDRSHDGTYVGTTSQTNGSEGLRFVLVVANGTIRRVSFDALDSCAPDPDRVSVRLGIPSAKRFKTTKAADNPGGVPGGAPGEISIRGAFSGDTVSGRFSAELQNPQEPIQTCVTGEVTYTATRQAGAGN